ncbi:ATP-binding protein [Streptomyces sp. 2P-4]|uniref:ATP-binding protein n=1 Tax=Streptomyces sp. 2P-4 TaxID=2931974 RepID=UPI00254205FA|nr:ATP-binding protein [Streptomyces sp. 2P-4]
MNRSLDAGRIEEIEAAGRSLRERSAALADAFEAAAGAVRAGRPGPAPLAGEYAARESERSRLAARLAAAGRTWGPEAGFAELDVLLVELTAEAHAAAQREQELQSLRQTRAGLRTLLDGTAADAPHREPLEQSLAMLDQQIADLERLLHPSKPTEPAPGAGDHATGQDSAAQPPAGPAPAAGHGTAQAEPAPAQLPVSAGTRSGPADHTPSGSHRAEGPSAVPTAARATVPAQPVAAHDAGGGVTAGSPSAGTASRPVSDADAQPAAPAALPEPAQAAAAAAAGAAPTDRIPTGSPRTGAGHTAEDAPASAHTAPLPDTGAGAATGGALPKGGGVPRPAPGPDAAGPGSGRPPGGAGDRAPAAAEAAPRPGSWEAPDGSESPVARLVREGRFAEAYWLTVGSAEPAHRSECLAFAAAAFSCGDEEEAVAVMTGFDPDLEALDADRPALVLAAAASLRAGLLAGWPNDLLIQTELTSALPGNWGKLLERTVDAVRRYQRLDLGATRLAGDSEPALSRARLAAEAAELLDALPRQRIGYPRATQVRSRLIGSEQPLGRALAAISVWAEGTSGPAELDAIWELFRKRGSAERMIEEADAAIRTPKQAKEPIEAAAKRALLRTIEQVCDLLSRARALAAPAVDERSDSVTALRHALDQVREADAPPGVEGAAVLRLRSWLLGDDRSPSGAVPVRDPDGDRTAGPPGAQALLAAPDLPRAADGTPLPAEAGFREAVLALLEPADARTVLARYCERGDLHLADALVAALEQDLVPAIPAGLDAVPGDWRQRRDAEWSRWSAAHRRAHGAAGTLLAELRTQQLNLQVERELVGRLERLKAPTPEGAFGHAAAGIRILESEIRTQVDEYVRRLREALALLDPSAQDRRRVTSLLDNRDTVTAEECLSLLREGKPLPDWSATDSGAELERFTAGIELAGVRKASGSQGYSARPWAEFYLAGQPLTEGARSGLESWDALCRPATRGSEWQRHVPSVLRVIGLECQATPVRDHQHEVRGVLRLTARAHASETVPGYVAALGSAASSYTILVVSDEQRGRSPLELLDSSDSGACLIIYLYPLGLAGRREMAARARTAASQRALVIDPAVFGWVAARSPRSFRAAQRVTLPWTAYNPYTPFVAGLVPPEVFYGRQEEIATVTDRFGALFLYGGRQLGKSALLRKVQASFPGTPDRKAIYVDLKARGVGEAEPAERIWPVLEEELKRVGVLRADRAAHLAPDAVLARVERWLEENADRRVLVLADEADAFLTADSKAVRGRGGEATFANVLRLKGLMDRTDRRFKIVFAGLHQVQRFRHLSNVPLTHGGPDVLISTLKPTEAQRLVVEPMAAFGYRFERPELVWRVLAATNYQACLVQIFCERLVAALRGKSLASAQWPITVTDEDVRAVTGSAQVHRHIAERLRITINLEDRYRVLALVIALRSQEDGFQGGYDADDLLSAAKRHWKVGFGSLTASDVRIYLDEMVGLGLLIQLADPRLYAVRSPNVVNMLGTREDLELELRQTEFDLPYDYNPRFSRRFVGHDREGIARYSPLTEHQLSLVTAPGVAAVCLTEAHGPALVEAAVESYANARELAVRRAGPDTLAEAIAQDGGAGSPSVFLVDLRGRPAAEAAVCAEALHAHTTPGKGLPHRAAVLLVDPDVPVRQNTFVAAVVHPERWNADSLRAWPECPFDTPDKRRRVIELTGGWPNLLERTVHRIAREGSTLEAALEDARGFTGQAGFARSHLARVGLDDGVVAVLAEWAAYVEPGEGCTYADIASVTGLTLGQVDALVRRLSDTGVLDDGPDGCSLDRITFRALQAAADPS